LTGIFFFWVIEEGNGCCREEKKREDDFEKMKRWVVLSFLIGLMSPGVFLSIRHTLDQSIAPRKQISDVAVITWGEGQNFK